MSESKIIDESKQGESLMVSAPVSPNGKKLFLESYGCAMNFSDSEIVASILKDKGFTTTKDYTEADIIFVNTCAIREGAEQRVRKRLTDFKKIKKTNPDLKIAICGCMMQQPEIVEHIKKTYRHVDIVFGTHNLYKFPELLNNSIETGKVVVDVWNSTGSIAENMPIVRKDNIKSWVTVMYGCDNFCSYCIVPYVRGRERSRDITEIRNEVKKLAEDGCKEVTLL